METLTLGTYARVHKRSGTMSTHEHKQTKRLNKHKLTKNKNTNNHQAQRRRQSDLALAINSATTSRRHRLVT